VGVEAAATDVAADHRVAVETPPNDFDSFDDISAQTLQKLLESSKRGPLISSYSANAKTKRYSSIVANELGIDLDGGGGGLECPRNAAGA
jgi:hypothetical protein